MDSVRNNPGEPVPEETSTHSHLSRSSIALYLLHPSTMWQRYTKNKHIIITAFYQYHSHVLQQYLSKCGPLSKTRHKTHIQSFYCSSGICPGLPGWAGARKVKPIWIYWARDSEWQWHLLGHMQVCTSSQTTTPTSHHSLFTGWMPFLPPNQQRQSTEGRRYKSSSTIMYN